MKPRCISADRGRATLDGDGDDKASTRRIQQAREEGCQRSSRGVIPSALPRNSQQLDTDSNCVFTSSCVLVPQNSDTY